MDGGEGDRRDVRRPMNAFLIFCKRHRSIVREKNPDLDNRSVTRILGDLWANLKEEEKVVYTDLAKQYKDAFMKANPDYRWHNPEKSLGCQKSLLPLAKPTNAKVMKNEVNLIPEGSIIPGKLADPCNMGGLSLLLMAGEQSGHVAATSPRSLETSLTQPLRVQNEVKPEPTTADLETEAGSVTEREPAVVTDGLPREPVVVTDSLPRRMGNNVEGDTNIGGNQGSEYAGNQKDMQSGVKLENRITRTWVDVKDPIGDKFSHADIVQTKINSGETLSNVSVLDTGPVTAMESFTHKSLLYQAVAAPKLPQRSLLAEAFRDKGGYPDILRDNSTSTKMANFENQGKLLEDQMNNSTLEQKMINKTDEKENLSKRFTKEIKSNNESQTSVEEESAMVTCGKLVVNHIIDKLYSSELGTAVRKRSTDSDEVDGGGKDEQDCKANIKVEGCEIKTENTNRDSVEDVKPNVNGKGHITASLNIRDSSEENDENKAMIKLKETSEEISKDIKDDCNSKFPNKKSSKRNFNSGAESTECESEDVDEFQPVRKSRRRNRGQRYQELINEGIIQRSKERTAAMQQTTLKEESNEEEYSQPIETLNSYILPETAIRRIRKRTTSESAKDKMLHPDDIKRYKTGDFDLEAQIATLPACSVENMGRKRGFARQRHSSECFHTNRKLLESETSPQSVPVFDVERAVCRPPHIRLPSENSAEPVVGSRKRKARKHSITHMIPAPPTLVKNGKVKADGDSLGPCMIKPPVQMQLEKSDSSVKNSQSLSVPSKGTGISVTSEKCSDWFRYDQMSDTDKSGLPEAVSDKTNTVGPRLDSKECVSENKNLVGSSPCESRDCSLTSKTVTQSEEILTNQSVGACKTESVHNNDISRDKQKCKIKTETGCEEFTNNHNKRETSVEDVLDENTIVSKQSSKCVVMDTDQSDQSDMVKISKDVNSNTTMNS